MRTLPESIRNFIINPRGSINEKAADFSNISTDHPNDRENP